MTEDIERSSTDGEVEPGSMRHAAMRARRALGLGRALALGAALLSAAPGAAQYQGGANALHIDIAIQENAADGRLSLHGFDWDVAAPFALVEDYRAHVRGIEIDQFSLLLRDPGFVSRVSPAELSAAGLVAPAAGEPLLFNVLSPPLSTMPSLGGRTLSFWDGTPPVTWGPKSDPDEGILIYAGQVSNPTTERLVDGGTTDVSGFTIGVSSGIGTLHEHIGFLLLPDGAALPPLGPDDGIYLMLMEFSYPAYAEWIPAFLGLAAFAGDSSVHRDAELAIATELLNPLCSDGIDNDKDGTIDFGNDAGCIDGDDMSERGAVAQCDNGIDDDGDGFVDFHDLDGDGISEAPGDSGCLHPTNAIEAPEPGFALGLGVACMAATVARRRRGGEGT